MDPAVNNLIIAFVCFCVATGVVYAAMRNEDNRIKFCLFFVAATIYANAFIFGYVYRDEPILSLFIR